MADLNAAQRYALRWLAERTTPETRLRHDEAASAWALGDAMKKAGLFEGRGHNTYRNGTAIAASRSLSALRRRGLAENSTPGGGAFQATCWRITAAGVEEVRREDL